MSRTLLALVACLALTLPSGCAPAQEPPAKQFAIGRSQSLNDAVDALWESGTGGVRIGDHIGGDWTEVTFYGEGTDVPALAARYGLTSNQLLSRYPGANLLVFTRGDAFVAADCLDADVFARAVYGRAMGRGATVVGHGVRKQLTVEVAG